VIVQMLLVESWRQPKSWVVHISINMFELWVVVAFKYCWKWEPINVDMHQNLYDRIRCWLDINLWAKDEKSFAF
jgi:hypothetical protein